MASDFMYLHGRLFLSDRNDLGQPTNFKEMPSTSDIELNLETSDIEHTDKSSSIASLDLSIPYMVKGSGKCIVDSSLARVIALALFGEEVEIEGGVFADVEFEKSEIETGDIVPIPGGRTHIESLTIKDDDDVALALDTNYVIVDADAGLVQFIGDLSGFEQPFQASGAQAENGRGIGIFQQRTVEKYARFSGINLADDDAKKVIDWYRMQFSPTASWKVMGDGTEVQKWELAFKLLKDATKPTDATFGQFGQYVEF